METFKANINGQEFNSREEFEKTLSALMKSEQDINIKIEEEKCDCNENDCQCKCKQPEQTFEFLTPEDARKGLELLLRMFGTPFMVNQPGVKKEQRKTIYETPTADKILETLFCMNVVNVQNNEYEAALDEISSNLKNKIEYFSKETGKLYGFYRAGKISDFEYESFLNHLKEKIQDRQQLYVENADSDYCTIEEKCSDLADVNALESIMNLIDCKMTQEIIEKKDAKIKELNDFIAEKEYERDVQNLYVDYTEELLEIINNSQLV